MQPDHTTIFEVDHTAEQLDAMPLASCSRCGRISSSTPDTRCLMPQPDGTCCNGRFTRDTEASTPGSRAAGPDERTLGGIPSAEERRSKRESGQPVDGAGRRTTREIPAVSDPEAPWDRRGLPSPELPPPDHALALEMAVEFLSGQTGQANIGRDGAEALARRVRADTLDLQILDVWRSCHEGTGSEALIREQCRTALGLPMSAALPADRIDVARAWCKRFINNQTARDHAMADAARANRLYTPCEDGSCMVCGEPVFAHAVDIDDGCPANGARTCRAVAP